MANATRRADASLPGDLVALLDVPEGKRLSELERMRRPSTRTTGNAMKGALERVDEIAAFRLGKVKVEQIPPNRLVAPAKNGLGSKARTWPAPRSRSARRWSPRWSGRWRRRRSTMPWTCSRS
ncbi:hypothetical protein GCM10022384_48550 [Streptomyces marokkonensis]|uniref:Uncharacterized protein n=1 Tax=Streptomyces marokkonensis TaxID=324855 RepID=A0ABP7RCX7_9ACTN